MGKTIRFDQIESCIQEGPGIYEIHTDTGIPLKVGIGGSLRKRLSQQRASRQSCLKLKPSGHWSRPDDVKAKGSILAKHLYFDHAITCDYDLRTEAGRRGF